jgi:hypothetical protein
MNIKRLAESEQVYEECLERTYVSVTQIINERFKRAGAEMILPFVLISEIHKKGYVLHVRIGILLCHSPIGFLVVHILSPISGSRI